MTVYSGYCFNLKEFSMPWSSARKSLSAIMRFSTCVQLWITVEWSRLPTSLPIRAAGILVYFCARYMLTCRATT